MVRTHCYNTRFEAANLSRANFDHADLESAVLRRANMTYVNLAEATTRRAHFTNATFEGAHFDGVDFTGSKLAKARLDGIHLGHGIVLCWVDVRGTNIPLFGLAQTSLSETFTNKRYIQVVGIGSRKGTTTYIGEDDLLVCGCFSGTVDEFEAQVKKTYVHESQYFQESLGVIAYFRSLRDAK